MELPPLQARQMMEIALSFIESKRSIIFTAHMFPRAVNSPRSKLEQSKAAPRISSDIFELRVRVES